MPEFSRSNIKEHRLDVNKYIGGLGIGYVMIIGRDLMVKLGLMADFKHHFLKWDGVIVPMK